MERPLRIAVFSDSARPILNGVSVSIASLIDELRDRGHSVHLFTAAYYGYRDPDPNTHRFTSFPTPWAKGYPLATPPFYPMLRQFRRQTFDLVHTHTPWTIGFVGLRWAESHGLPVVTTYHTQYDKYTHYVPLLPKRYVRYRIAKHTHYYYNRADQVIVPSEAARRWLQRHSVHRPITIVPTGTPPPRLLDRAETRARLGLRPEAKVMLYVGRIAREKNMAVLLESVAAAMAQDPRVVFWLVGDGPYREACVQQVRELGIGDRVRFVGFVPREDVDQFYAVADLFVFASMTETQGLVVAEAMSYGLPAVVVQGGGAGAPIRDGENGYLVRNDPGVLALQAVRILQDDQLHARLSEGARRTPREYTAADMTDRVLEIYRAALGMQPRPVVRAGVPT